MEKWGKMKRQIIFPQVCSFKVFELAFMILPSKRKCKWNKNKELIWEDVCIHGQEISPAYFQPPLHNQEEKSTEICKSLYVSLNYILSHTSTDCIKSALYFRTLTAKYTASRLLQPIKSTPLLYHVYKLTFLTWRVMSQKHIFAADGGGQCNYYCNKYHIPAYGSHIKWIM